uniref:G_PROTEIN_RECEP_F1_2 domain-containing protein n=1 Tax=Angiostrongylus cantonensis TaxID=6313 RepID=A0A0K0DR42_ANGCA
MYRGEIKCGPSSFLQFNESTIHKARKCVIEEFHPYYDGCMEKCIVDRYILPLSHHQHLEQVVYGQIFPTLVVLAALANVAVALVLSKKNMVSPTNVVLKYMAIAELLVGVIPLPWTIFFYTMGNYNRTYNLELWWCYLNKYSMDAFPPVFHNIAMWLTVLLAGQRYISISYPLHSRGTSSVSNVRTATVIIAVSFILHGIKLVDVHCLSCVVGQTPLLHLIGQTLFFNLYFWTRAIGFIILPSVLLVILNILLIKGIQRAQKRKLRLLREKRPEEAARQRDSNSTSLMLVVIVSLFLVVNLPQAAFMGVLCVCETFSIRFSLLEGAFPAVFLLTSNMLVMVSTNIP